MEGAIAGQLRDTTEFYVGTDPLAWVDQSLIGQIRSRCGRTLLDLGCGLGGYSRKLMDAGYTVKALDVNPAYVSVAASLGVDAALFDGVTIPLPDASVDTVFMVEVLEHVREPENILREVFRVARKNVVVTVPNNTQRLDGSIAWSHMLDVDHKNFFTVSSLTALLSQRFKRAEVVEVAAVDWAIAQDVLSPRLFFLYRLFRKLGLERDKLYFRLVGEGVK